LDFHRARVHTTEQLNGFAGRKADLVLDFGVGQVFVASYPALDNRRQVSATGGLQPRWRGDGKELYFIEPGTGKVMMAAVKPGSLSDFTVPVPLFQGPLPRPNAVMDQWDVTRDGQRFLFAAPLNQVNARPLMAVLNWTNLLPKK
jgi:eukaryotic-like serine/threonine-protein kinase